MNLKRRKFLSNLIATGVISAVAPASLLSAPTNLVGTMPMVTVDAKGIVTCASNLDWKEFCYTFNGQNSNPSRYEAYKVIYE